MPDEPFEPKTDESWESRMVRDWLRKPFKPEQIGKLPATPKRPALDFVGHAAVTDRLNKIAPDWSYTIDNMSTIGDTIWIRITMTIGGVSRPDFGDGKDPKEALGNALRRAAMRFGVAIDLWSREELESSPAAGPASPPQGARQGAATKGEPDSSPAGGITSPATQVPPAISRASGDIGTTGAGDTSSGPEAGGRPSRVPTPAQDPGPGTTSDVGEASGSAPGGQPKPPGVTTYPVDPLKCSHKFPSGRWLKWDADDRCPKCGTPKVSAVEGTTADLSA